MARQTWSYAIPYVGKYAYGYDRFKDLMQKQRDYERNTRRKVAYGTDSYGAQAMHTLGNVSTSAINSAGRTVRRLI